VDGGCDFLDQQLPPTSKSFQRRASGHGEATNPPMPIFLSDPLATLRATPS
jgi:hypothetical protein